MTNELNSYIEDNKKQILLNQFKKSKDIDKEIDLVQKKSEILTNQIKMLQEKLMGLTENLTILREIKDSQKTFLNIDSKIEEYISTLKANNVLNIWSTTLSSDNDTMATNMYSIKNASYTATIIANHNKKRGFYRVDYEFSLASVLINLAKEHKQILLNTHDIKIAKEGKVMYSEIEFNNYIQELKEKAGAFFTKERAPLMREIKDIDNAKYRAEDLLLYDNMLIDEYEVIDGEYPFKEEEEEVIL